MVNRDKQQSASQLGSELRRGTLVLAVLNLLRQEQYGYSLREMLVDKGLEANESTLYPLLRRLEAQGLLSSTWQLTESRPRRYYQTSPQGEKMLAELELEWASLVQAMADILKND